MDFEIRDRVYDIYIELLAWCYDETNRVKASKLKRLADKYKYVHDNNLYLKKWR